MRNIHLDFATEVSYTFIRRKFTMQLSESQHKSMLVCLFTQQTTHICIGKTYTIRIEWSLDKAVKFICCNDTVAIM